MIAVPATLVSTFLITFFMGFEDVQDDESAAEAK
jgi:hypothetical protein